MFISECPHYSLALFSSFINNCTQLTTGSVVSCCWSAVSVVQASQWPCLHQLHALSTVISRWPLTSFTIGLCLFSTPSLPLISVTGIWFYYCGGFWLEGVGFPPGREGGHWKQESAMICQKAKTDPLRSASKAPMQCNTSKRAHKEPCNFL